MSWVLCDWLALASLQQRHVASQTWETTAALFAAEPYLFPAGDWLLGFWPLARIQLMVGIPAHYSLLAAASPLALKGAFFFDLTGPALPTKAYNVKALVSTATSAQFVSRLVVWIAPAERATSFSVNLLDPLALLREFDVALLGFELLFAAAILSFVPRFGSLLRANKIFYDDLVTFSIYNNLSLTELGTLLSLVGGFLLFDLFISVTEEDLADTASYALFLLVIGLFLFLLLAVDIQYFYMVSSVSSGDLTLRTIVSDLVNNFLCALRIFFCWVRYVFYDLQVEFIDFTFHYTDTANDILLTPLFEPLDGGAQWAAKEKGLGDRSLWEALKLTLFGLLVLFADLTFFILQVLIGLFKLFIAFFLLWLIVDLFILKAFALSESRALVAKRSNLPSNEAVKKA